MPGLDGFPVREFILGYEPLGFVADIHERTVVQLPNDGSLDHRAFREGLGVAFLEQGIHAGEILEVHELPGGGVLGVAVGCHGVSFFCAFSLFWEKAVSNLC